MFTNKKYLYTTASNNYYREYELNINKIKFMKFFTNKISLLPHAHIKYAGELKKLTPTPRTTH